MIYGLQFLAYRSFFSLDQQRNCFILCNFNTYVIGWSKIKSKAMFYLFQFSIFSEACLEGKLIIFVWFHKFILPPASYHLNLRVWLPQAPEHPSSYWIKIKLHRSLTEMNFISISASYFHSRETFWVSMKSCQMSAFLLSGAHQFSQVHLGLKLISCERNTLIIKPFQNWQKHIWRNQTKRWEQNCHKRWWWPGSFFLFFMNF